MNVQAPTMDDIEMILSELDDDASGAVDKEEFCSLIMMVFGKMLE